MTTTIQRLNAELETEMRGNTLSGHAATFKTYARIGGGWEGIARTGFDQVLKDDVPALINHDMNLVLARTSSGTLKLATDDSGLYFEAQLGQQTYARDLRESVQRGDISGCSFGFVPGQVEHRKAKDGHQLRMHTRMKRLLDVSPVTYPAYEGTDVLLRTLELEEFHESSRSRLIKARARVLFGDRERG